MSDPIAEANQRHYQRMRDALADKRDVWRTDSLDSLIQDLDALLAALEGVSEEWILRFRRPWELLEVVLAVALDEGRMSFTGEERALIDGALRDLRDLLDETGQEAGEG
jgi:hypothetical protein